MTTLSVSQRAWRWGLFTGILPFGILLWLGGAYLSHRTGVEAWHTVGKAAGQLTMFSLLALRNQTMKLMDDPAWWKWLLGCLAGIGLAAVLGKWLFTCFIG